MKYLYFLTLFALCTLQGSLMAQSNDGYYTPPPQLEVQVQKLPSNTEGPDNNDQTPYSLKAVHSHPNFPVNNQNNDQDKNKNFNQDPYAAPSPDELRTNQKIERTLSILKPDALKNRHIGDIISRFEDKGLRVAAIKMIKLTRDQAAQFYQIHHERPFFAELIKYMSSGPIIVMVLEGNQAISKNRQIMGATDPQKADKGTIRADFAESMSQNSVHGSDSVETARQEIALFFLPDEIYQGY